MSTSDYFGLFFFIIPGCGVSLLVFAYFTTLAIDNLRAKNWPQYLGKIVESTMIRGRGGDDGFGFTPSIRFEYEADGVPRESRHFAFHRWSGSRARAEATIARYPVGSTVTVYHNAERPEHSVLETGYAGYSVAIAVFAGLPILLAIGAFWGMIPVSDGG